MLVDGVPDLGRERQSWPVPDIAAGHPSDAGHQGRVGGQGAALTAASGGSPHDEALEAAGPSRAPGHERGYPRSLLRRVEEPPASPTTRARTPLLQLVVVPRTAALQAAEDAL